MRIEPPYGPAAHHLQVFLDGKKCDAVYACDDEEGWVDSYDHEKVDGSLKLLLKDGEPNITRHHGKVTFLSSEVS